MWFSRYLARTTSPSTTVRLSVRRLCHPFLLVNKSNAISGKYFKFVTHDIAVKPRSILRHEYKLAIVSLKVVMILLENSLE